MTAISTILSVVTLPLNLLIYAKLAYGDDIVGILDWGSLMFALTVVILAISTGLWATAKFDNSTFRLNANRVGNVAGVCLVIFSCIVSSVDKQARIWNQAGTFYLAVSLPCLLGLVIATVLTSFLRLWKPERVSVSIESCCK